MPGGGGVELELAQAAGAGARNDNQPVEETRTFHSGPNKLGSWASSSRPRLPRSDADERILTAQISEYVTTSDQCAVGET